MRHCLVLNTSVFCYPPRGIRGRSVKTKLPCSVSIFTVVIKIKTEYQQRGMKKVLGNRSKCLISTNRNRRTHTHSLVNDHINALFLFLSLCLSVCLSVCLSLSLSLCLSVSLSHIHISLPPTRTRTHARARARTLTV